MYSIKNIFRDWYQPHESFVLRNPLFPVESFFNWKSLQGITAAASREDLLKLLREFYLQPIAREALYIGSPDLHQQLLLWLDNKIDKPDKKEKTELALVKYMTRMCTRCTPYGLFASCSYGSFSGISSILLNGKNSVQRRGRLDMDYVCQLLTNLLQQREVSGQLLFYPNSSIYPFGSNWRYTEHRFSEQAGRSYHLVQVEHSIYLEKILQAANKGGSPAALANIISGDGISYGEAIEFVYELVQSQVLVSELEPNVTGEAYFYILLRRLRSLKHTSRYVHHLEEVVKEFNRINMPQDELKNGYYPRIVQHLQQLEAPVHLKTLIQVDSLRPVLNCTLGKKINEDLLMGASLLQLLTTVNEAPGNFSDFKQAFSLRYESQWMPLVDVLDTESGIGYGKFVTTGMEESPLINKLIIGEAATAINTIQQPGIETFKWQLYEDAITGNKTEISLADSTIEQLLKKERTLTGMPDSFYMMILIHAGSGGDIDRGDYQISIQPPSGPSGGNLLGRFCHLHPGIQKFAHAILQQEEKQSPDCIFAEVVHLPESRVGNILVRPVLREYEIPYLCGSTVGKRTKFR